MKVTYISWAEQCSRSDYTARELDGTSHMVYWGALGSRLSTVWLKYLWQAWRTWRILSAERPTAAFVMTPPVFAGLVVWAWCATHSSRLVLDAHTAAFVHQRWRHFQRLQFWLARRAATTIVHNQHFKDTIEREGAHATLVPDIPIRFPDGEYPLPVGLNIAVVCSFNPDEPIGAMLEAAEQLPDVHFHVTGDPRLLDPRLRQNIPSNVKLTGFLSRADYGALIRGADAVMTLTTRDHTMLRGAWEAMYQATPVIVSNWPILKQSFDEGAVHVDNTADDILRAVRQMQAEHAILREGARNLRRRREERWTMVREGLRGRLGV